MVLKLVFFYLQKCFSILSLNQWKPTRKGYFVIIIIVKADAWKEVFLLETNNIHENMLPVMLFNG